jgi:hypothetical protein
METPEISPRTKQQIKKNVNCRHLSENQTTNDKKQMETHISENQTTK